MVFSSFVVNQHMSKNFHGMRNKATYKGLIWTAPAWARSGWCLEMISWRQPPHPFTYLIQSYRTAVKSCIWSLPGGISVDNVQHNNLLGWGLGYFICSTAEEQGTVWNRSSLWEVPSSRDVCCCLCAGQAASPEKKPGGLLTWFVLYCSLENCRGPYDHVLLGFI